MRLDNMNVHEISSTLRGISRNSKDYREDLRGMLTILLTKIGGKYIWSDFTQDTIGRHREYAGFAEYLEDWCEFTISDFRDLFHADMRIINLLDEVEQRPAHRPVETVDNVHSSKDRPAGNSKEAGLRRLRKDRPDLHELVMEGSVSINKAMVDAGFRRPTRTIPVDTPESAINALLRIFTKDQLRDAL